MPVGAGFIPARIGENKKMTEHKKLQPEIRFAGFTDDWEQRKFLDNIESIIDFRGRTPRKLGMEWGESGYLALSALNVKNGCIDPSVDAHFGDEALYQKWMTGNELKQGQVLFTTEAPMGNVAQIPDDKKYILSQRTIAFNIKEKYITDDFLAVLLRSPNVFNDLDSLSSGGTAKGISQKSLSNLYVKVPNSLEEQTQIGNFFKQLDDTIALHQRTLEKYQKLKISYLEKMFPKENELYPELRFPNFTDAWEQRKLGDVFGKIRNAFVGTATPYYVTSGHFYLESNNIKNGQINRDSEIFINEYFYQKQKDKWLKSGDMVMVQSGHVGHTAIIPDELHNSIAHALIMFTDYLDKSVPYFFNFFFQTNKAKREIDKITTGNTVKHILASDMKDFPIFLPSYEEQTQIGNFFKQLDDTIALHQREVEKYKKIKQSYLENMFI